MSFQKMILKYAFKHNKTSKISMFKIISRTIRLIMIFLEAKLLSN